MTNNIQPIVIAPGMDVFKWQKLTWVDIKQPREQEMQYLAQNYHFHPLNLDDCVSKVHLPKVNEYENYVFIILHFPVFNRNTRISVPSQVAIFLGKDLLVTVHSGDLTPLVEMSQSCHKNDKVCGEYMGKDSCYLLYRIVDVLVDYCFPLVDKNLSNLDKIEDKVFDPKVDSSQQITILRRDIAAQRRIIRLVRDVVAGLESKLRAFSEVDLKAYFSDINDHLNHLWNDIEECHETIEIYKDTHLLLRQEKTNKIMALLTILFTISLPATVTATFFGMHVNIPGGSENGGWIGPLGPYTTFIVVLLISFMSAVIMFLLFRRWRWL
jgi:magnesium transporter